MKTDEYLKKHFEIVSYITSVMINIYPSSTWTDNKICQVFTEDGTEGLYRLAKEWADEFKEGDLDEFLISKSVL